VPNGNAEVFEMMEITHVPPTRLNVHLLTVISVFRSAFRSRAAVELEDFALRHQLNVLKRSLKRRPTGCCGSSCRDFGLTGARR
jgi:hypothetical protein